MIAVRLISPFTDDDGVSLAELIVVTALMGMLLAGAYAGLTLAGKAGEVQRRDAFIAERLVVPLQTMDIILSQNITMNTTADGYSFDCMTDQNKDSIRERHVFECTTGGQLVQRVYFVDTNGVQTLHRTSVWQPASADPAQRNANRLTGRPLITYYRRDASGNPVNATAATATEAQLYVEVQYEGQYYNDSRVIMFRNR